MVNKLHHLEALVVCDAVKMYADFGKLNSHPSLQTIKLLTDKCTFKAFTSVLQLRQLQELWIMNLWETAYEVEEVSSSPVFSSKASQTIPRQCHIFASKSLLCSLLMWWNPIDDAQSAREC